MIRRILLVAAALAAATAAVSQWWILLIAVALYCVPVLLARRREGVRLGGDADQTAAAIVLSVATGIVVLHAGAASFALWDVAILLAALHALHLGRHVLRVLVFRRWRSAADWRGVQVPVAVPRRVLPVAGPTLVPIPVWILAPLCALYRVSPLIYVLLDVVSLMLVAVTFLPLATALLHNLRLPAERDRLVALTSALRTAKPEILVHFNAPATSTYALAEWMTVLEALSERHRVVILTVDRQPWHFAAITTTQIPIVHLNGAEAIESFVEQIPSLAVALYPRNTSPNKNLLRVPGLYDIYIGHGESDKAEAANPATRAFDEVWIAGDAARSRYLDAGIDIRADQLRITGRPQVGALLERAALAHSNDRKSVVYAPTWEGYYAEDGYGSVAAFGEQVVTALLARGDLDVTYVPHPALGSLNPRFANASANIVARIARAGARSVIRGAQSERFAALAGADLLIADIGSDLVDYLALDRPYITLNPSGAPDAASFAAANPSSSAGIVIDLASIGEIGGVVDNILGTNPSSPGHSRSGYSRNVATAVATATRSQLAARYLGDLSVPPQERFLAEVENTLTHVRATRPRPSLPPSTTSTNPGATA